MSDISISVDTMQSMAFDSQMAGPESIKDTTSEVSSGVNQGTGMDSMEQTIAGAEVA